jgi:hypothetical protein
MHSWKQRFTKVKKVERHFLWKTEQVVISEAQMRIALQNPKITLEDFEEVVPISKEEAEDREEEAMDEIPAPLTPEDEEPSST